MSTVQEGGAAAETVDLDIGGMTCASCAARVERRLNRLDGVEAAVNYATERAHVRVPAGYDTALLVAEVERTGYSATAPKPPADDERDPLLVRTRARLLVAVVLAVPVIVLAMVPALQFPAWQWVSLALATPVVFWAGWPFHAAAARNLRHGAATMDTLISLGTLAAYGWSVGALVFGSAGMIGMRHGLTWFASPGDAGEALYLEVAAGVTMFVLAGRYAELSAKRRSGAALRALLALEAKDVGVLRDGVERREPVDGLRVGDVFVVRPGEKIATDGVVVEGASSVDRSTITGESAPVDAAPGDAVTGASVNVGGRLVVRATNVGADTQLARMTRLVTQAQSGKAAVQRLADRISGVFVPIVLAIAVVTAAVWLVVTGDATLAFSAAVAVLIIACPCALGLATPTALLVGTGRGAQLGILIRGPEVLESTRRVDTVLLDKTGTITEGRMRVVRTIVADGVDAQDFRRRAGAAEDASEHPIAAAIAVDAARSLDGAPWPAASAFQNAPGLGVSAIVEGVPVVVGRPALLADWAMRMPETLTTALDDAEAAGHTVVAAGWDGAVRGLFVVADAVRPEAAEAVAGLRALGLRPVLLTGDNPRTAAQVAAVVGIDDVRAGVLPSGKAETVAALQAEGRVVAMIGDGVNDAPALATADLGIAMGSGTDVAIEAADVTLVRGDLRAAVDAVRLSRRTLRTIQTNLFWAFAYNVAAIPIAAVGLLNPMLAGAAMAVSSVFVVGNSLRLRGFRSDVEGTR